MTRRRPCDACSRAGEVDAERVVQHDRHALLRRKLVQHHQECQPNRLVGDQLLQRIRLGAGPADVVTTGSGSHGPVYDSRRTRADRK